MVDEGGLTWVMSLSFWKSIGLLDIVQSLTMHKDFHRHTFRPHRIIPSFPVELRVKIVLIEVEIVDAPLN